MVWVLADFTQAAISPSIELASARNRTARVTRRAKSLFGTSWASMSVATFACGGVLFAARHGKAVMTALTHAKGAKAMNFRLFKSRKVNFFWFDSGERAMGDLF